MTDLLSAPPLNLTTDLDSAWPNPSILTVTPAGGNLQVVFPSGALRIGGDSPSGLVTLNGAPVARTVRLYDMETGELVAETTSAGDGTYSFPQLAARTDGYGIWIVGNAGERGVIIPAIAPG